jgi:hypothetical protein
MPSIYNFTNLTREANFYGIIFVTGTGIISNILNIRVSMRKELQKTSMGFYNIFLSVINMFILILYASIFFPPTIGLNDLTLTYKFACILMPYLVFVFLQVNGWILVMISYERVKALSYKIPRSIRVRQTIYKKKVSLKILGIFIVTCILNSPGFFFGIATQTHFDTVSNTTNVITVCTSSPLIVQIRDLARSMLRIVIPLILQVILSIILIRKLLHVKNILTTSISLKREYRYALTIVFLNGTYIVTDLITLICTILLNTYGYNQTLISNTSTESAVSSFAFVISLLLTFFTLCSFLFVANLLSNKKFRKETQKSFAFNSKRNKK